MNWIPYLADKLGNQPLPPPYHPVLLEFAAGATNSGSAPAIVAGYLKYLNGDKTLPKFVTPGIVGSPSYWCDCLPREFGEPGANPHWGLPLRNA